MHLQPTDGLQPDTTNTFATPSVPTWRSPVRLENTSIIWRLHVKRELNVCQTDNGRPLANSVQASTYIIFFIHSLVKYTFSCLHLFKINIFEHHFVLLPSEPSYLIALVLKNDWQVVQLQSGDATAQEYRACTCFLKLWKHQTWATKISKINLSVCPCRVQTDCASCVCFF